jgi:hypothetical protein
MKNVLLASSILLVCFFPMTAFAQSSTPSSPSLVPPPTGRNVPPVTFAPNLNNKKGGFIPNVPPFIPNPRFDSSKPVSAANPQFVPGFPNDFPIPMHPWYGVMDPKKVNYGSVVQYIEVPPQQVVINVYVPGPGSFPGEFEPQVVEIPGYLVAETTTGYVYPARVGLRQMTPGVFNWVTEPSVFVLK